MPFESKAFNYYCYAYRKGFGKSSSLFSKIKLEALGQGIIYIIIPREICSSDSPPPQSSGSLKPFQTFNPFIHTFVCSLSCSAFVEHLLCASYCVGSSETQQSTLCFQLTRRVKDTSPNNSNYIHVLKFICRIFSYTIQGFKKILCSDHPQPHVFGVKITVQTEELPWPELPPRSTRPQTRNFLTPVPCRWPVA